MLGRGLAPIEESYEGVDELRRMEVVDRKGFEAFFELEGCIGSCSSRSLPFLPDYELPKREPAANIGRATATMEEEIEVKHGHKPIFHFQKAKRTRTNRERIV